MRIISDFKDYYDSALSFGSDPNLKYVRRQEQFEFLADSLPADENVPRVLYNVLRAPLELLAQLPRKAYYRNRHQHMDEYELAITSKIIGFCGFYYPALELDGTTSYDFDQILPGVSDNFLHQAQIRRKKFEQILAQELDWKPDYWHKPPLCRRCWTRAVGSNIIGRRFDDVFIALGKPVFKLEWVAPNKPDSIDIIRCTLNPFLKSDSFQRVKSPVEAFQEISMYLGTQLARQPDPSSNIPDDVLRDEKGFDKWSFRRHKQEDKKYKKHHPE